MGGVAAGVAGVGGTALGMSGGPLTAGLGGIMNPFGLGASGLNPSALTPYGNDMYGINVNPTIGNTGPFANYNGMSPGGASDNSSLLSLIASLGGNGAATPASQTNNQASGLNPLLMQMLFGGGSVSGGQANPLGSLQFPLSGVWSPTQGMDMFMNALNFPNAGANFNGSMPSPFSPFSSYSGIGTGGQAGPSNAPSFFTGQPSMPPPSSSNAAANLPQIGGPGFATPGRVPSYGQLPAGVTPPDYSKILSGFNGQQSRLDPWVTDPTVKSDTPAMVSDYSVRNAIADSVKQDMGYSSSSPLFFPGNAGADNNKAYDLYSQRMNAAGLGGLVGPKNF